MAKLIEKKCIPCEGIGRPLSKQEAQSLLSQIEGWKMDSSGKIISREWVMKNFSSAVEFIHSIAEVAESENHHPDVHLTNYRHLRVDLSTHALNGLSENDFIVAAKINELFAEFKK